MHYNEMTDAELANVMVNYIVRVNHLQNIISDYLNGNDNISSLQIKKEYEKLKVELREDAHDLGLRKNYHGSALYKEVFVPSIKEAAAFGFGVPIHGTVNQLMYNSVAEACYKLTKYYSLEEWGGFL